MIAQGERTKFAELTQDSFSCGPERAVDFELRTYVANILALILPPPGKLSGRIREPLRGVRRLFRLTHWAEQSALGLEPEDEHQIDSGLSVR